MTDTEKIDVRLLKELSGHNSVISYLSINKSYQLVSTSKDNQIKLWDLISGKILKSFEYNLPEIKKAIFSPNKPELFCFIDSKNKVKFVDTETFNSPFQVNLDSPNNESEEVINFDYSHDGKSVAIAFFNGKIKVLKENRFISFESGNSYELLSCICYSSDGNYLSASRNNKILLWNTSITDQYKLLEGHENNITCLIFSPDNKTLISSSQDKTIRIWDVKTGKEISCLKGHTGYVNSITISKDGSYLISGSHDLTIKIWDLLNYKHVKTITGNISPIYTVLFYPDDSHFLSAGSDKKIKIWKVLNYKNIIVTNSINKIEVIEPKEIKYNDLWKKSTLDESDDFDDLINYYSNDNSSNESLLVKENIVNEVINSNLPKQSNYNFEIQEYKPNDIFKILNFNPTNLFHKGEIIHQETVKQLNKTIFQLEKLIENNQDIQIKRPDNIADTYKLFFDTISKNPKAIFSEFDNVSKIRRLAWAIFYKEKNNPSIFETEYFPNVLKIIDNHWRYTMFFGLFESYLSLWGTSNEINMNILREFLADKLRKYNKNLQNILKLKSNEKYFFNKTGTLLLGSEILTSEKKLSEVCSTLNLPEHMINYQYFSDVAYAYTQTAIRNSNLKRALPEIISFLKLHQQSITNKKCLSKLIIKIQQMNDLDLQEDIKEQAFKLIGDPSIDSLWLPWKDANSEEINDLKKAQSIISDWITQQFIELFFNNLSMDRDRKEFWERYLKHIKKFKIYGSQSLYNTMKRDKRVEPYLGSRFGFLKPDSGLSAFIMHVRDYMLIEFSTTGNAFYGYRVSNAHSPNIEKRELSINNLKKKQLCDIWMVHSGRWQSSFSSYLRENLGI